MRDELKLPRLPRSEYTNMQYQRRHIGTVYTADDMRSYAKQAVRAEREACAQVADLYHIPMAETFADAIAQDIRARSQA